MSFEPVIDEKLGQAYECKSCGGVYFPDQPGGYYHKCPSGVQNPRDENIDDSDHENIHIKAEGLGRKVHMEEIVTLP